MSSADATSATPTANADPDRAAATPGEKSLVDWARDLLVYAPIGFALDAQTFVPQFVERGRNQVALARFIGQFAVSRLEKEMGPIASRAGQVVAPLLEGFGLKVPTPVQPATPDVVAEPAPVVPELVVPEPVVPGSVVSDAVVAPAPLERARSGTAAKKPPNGRRAATLGPAAASGTPPRTAAPASRKRARPAPAATPPVDTEPATVPRSDELAIPEYDGLAASQVVPRLASLSAAELRAVRRYETAHRGRRTILHGVEQLLTRAS